MNASSSWLMLTWMACTSTTVDAPPTEGAAWWWTLATDGPAFDAMMEEGRDGWAAYHRNDYPSAYRTFAAMEGHTVPTARAAWAEARLHDDLARLVAHANRKRRDELARRKTTLGPVGAFLMAWGQRCSDASHEDVTSPEVPPQWLNGMSRGARCAASEAPSCAPLPELPDDVPPSIRARNLLHVQLLQGESHAWEQLGAIVDQPVHREAADGFERRHMDPCIDATLSAAWRMRALQRTPPESSLGDWAEALADAGLEGSLFAPWPDAQRLSPRGASSPLGSTFATPLWSLPDGLALPLDGPPEGLQESIRAVSLWTDATTDALVAAHPQRRDHIQGLGLLKSYRQDVLIEAAREALLSDRPQPALTLLNAALDRTDADVGVANDPNLYVLLAEARLRTGRTRQALDALEPLTGRVPSVASARELVGDLAVMESMGRVGDSKEN